MVFSIDSLRELLEGPKRNNVGRQEGPAAASSVFQRRAPQGRSFSSGGSFGTPQESFLEKLARSLNPTAEFLLNSGQANATESPGPSRPATNPRATNNFDESYNKAAIDKIRARSAMGQIGDVANEAKSMYEPPSDEVEFSPQGTFGGPDYSESMMQQIMEMMGPAPTMDDIGLDPEQMAQEQFDPQFQLLNQLRQQAQGRYKRNSSQTQQMYQDLANQIRQEAGNRVPAQYDATAQSIDAAFGQSGENIQNRARQSNQQMTGLMKQLGIEEAAPGMFEDTEQARSSAINNLESTRANYLGTNEQLGQNQEDFLRNTAATSQLEGSNRVADLTEQLGGILGGYDNRELDLEGQQQQAENDYMMQIQEMLQGANQAYGSNIQGMLDSMMDQGQWQQEFGLDQWRAERGVENDRAQRELQAAQFEAEQRRLAQEQEQDEEQDWTNNASGYAINEAHKVFSQGPYAQRAPELAQAAMKGVQDAMVMSPADIDNLGDLWAALDARFPNNPYRDQYRHVASAWWQAMGLGNG